jgi:hypothetical protein
LHNVLLNNAKNGNSMVITHEQWVLTSSLSLDSLELKLFQFSSILQVWIIIYELITTYPRLIIKLELIIKQKHFIISFQRLSLNSNYRIESILLLNLVKLLWISKLKPDLNLNWIDLNKSDGKPYLNLNNTMQPGLVHSALSPRSGNGLAQQTEIGDRSPSPPALGSPVDSVQPAARGQATWCCGASLAPKDSIGTGLT